MSNFNCDVNSWIDDLPKWLGDYDFHFSDLDFIDTDSLSEQRRSTDASVNLSSVALSPSSSNASGYNTNVYITGRKKKNEKLSMSKNAILARQNRTKKKKFIDGLVTAVRDLNAENKVLKNKCDKYDTALYKLRKEVVYLRNIIANQTSLSMLLKNIPNLLNENFEKPSAEENIDVENLDIIKSDDDTAHVKENEHICSNNNQNFNSGICLHVANNIIQLELCSSCNDKAQLSVQNNLKLNG